MIKVAVAGFGYMGRGMVENIIMRKNLRLVGVADKFQEDLWQKKISDVIKTDKKVNVKISNSLEEMLVKGKPQIVLLATNSFVKELFSDIKLILENKINCVCIGEEMSWPWCENKKLSNELDKLAIKNKVTLLGTGINPGFVLDTLIVALSGVCSRVNSIEASRINDLSPFGPTVMKTQGVGSSPKEFAKGLKDGSIVGHIGFKQSINLIAKGLDLKIDQIKETRKPIISKVHRKTKCVKVKPGYVAGCNHTAIGYYQGKKIITLIHPQQIEPDKEKTETGDYIKLMGTPDISLSIKPEIPGGKGTIAIAVNCLEQVFEADPGLKTMLDMKYISCRR